jgi:hypothetical protein
MMANSGRSMLQSSNRGQIYRALQRILSFFKKKPSAPAPDDPCAEDPYAYVTAPKKPRPSNRSAAAVMELPEE